MCILCTYPMLAAGLSDTDVPAAPPQDAIMATPDEIRGVHEWVTAVFLKPLARTASQPASSAASSSNGLLDVQAVPFSFTLGGKPSGEILTTCQHSVDTGQRPHAVEHRIHWNPAGGGLRIIAQVKVHKQFPAVEWVLFLENQGTKDTPIIEDIQALDITLNTADEVVLHHLAGDSSSESSFRSLTTAIAAGQNVHMIPRGGRPSCTSAFPFFNVRQDDRGLITAIGWTGQWAASIDRSAEGLTRLRAGMERTRLILHPGERIRTPRILIMPWSKDRQAAHNRFRRLMLFHYSPWLNGRPPRLPIALQTYDRYHYQPDWATQEGMFNAARFAKRVGCDTLWLDAAWFPGGFPNGVGNWFCKPDAFPNGLRPVSDLCRELGLRFMVWFEPERVGLASQIATEHPDFVFKGQHDHLFKLNDPSARRWLTDLLSKRIDEFNLDIYRNDFNTEPLHAWRRTDTPDRLGMTEIRYVEGLYAMWDELREKHPGLLIDNCASGGRRIDLETCMRSVPLWRSDTNCSPGHADWNQAQTAGLSQYLPLHAACTWEPDAYDTRSAAGPGIACEWTYLDAAFPVEQAKTELVEIKALQKYWYGDFYPLTPMSIEPQQWMAYQFHRADLDAGMVLAFRRSQCPDARLTVRCAGVNPAGRYTLEFIDHVRTVTTRAVTGRELADGLELRLDKPGTSMLVRYAPAPRGGS